MPIRSILVANRGEIAIRIMRAGAELGLRTVAVYSEDDEESVHTHMADEAVRLRGRGAAAYLDGAAIIAVAKEAGCDAIHPGYGFLSERADFASQCAQANVTFIGPAVEHLELFGDKARARAAAVESGVPVLRGLDHDVSLGEAQAFLESLGQNAGMMIKAVAGGGGRGTRMVTSAGELETAFRRCQSEAKAAFGRDDLYVEEFITRARHIEVQIAGDWAEVAHLGERECSIQRRFQKVIEVAPAPGLDDDMRAAITDAAVHFARDVGYGSLGTFEFLIDVSGNPGAQPFVFIEANARLQVEHTVTEEVTGVDLVQTQIRLADGASLKSLGLGSGAANPRGFAIQARVNMEKIGPDGSVRPGGGTLSTYEAPGGPGVRTDGFGYAGYRTSSAFDSLLVKVIAHSPSPNVKAAVTRTSRALSEFRIHGVDTNIAFLQNVLNHPDFATGQVHTRWVEERITELAATGAPQQRRFVEPYTMPHVD